MGIEELILEAVWKEGFREGFERGLNEVLDKVKQADEIAFLLESCEDRMEAALRKMKIPVEELLNREV